MKKRLDVFLISSISEGILKLLLEKKQFFFNILIINYLSKKNDIEEKMIKK